MCTSSHTSSRSRRRLLAAIVTACAINLALAGALVGVSRTSTASAAQSPVTVKIQDDCDPATFNAVLGPDACVGDGDTTFTELFEQLNEDREAPKWRFSRERFGIKSGRHIVVPNMGGEFHTFTEVAEFGGGCIPELNGPLGLTPVAECQDEIEPGLPRAFVETGVPAGGSMHVAGLSKGKHLFECLIHPWMRSTVVVK